MNVVAAGDSFTYGEELSDLNNAWPFLVGNKIGGKVTNLAEPAGSNDKVVRKVIDHIINNPGQVNLVMIGWTSPGRMEFADEHGYYDLWPGYSGNLFARDSAHWRNDIGKYINIYHDRHALYLKYLQHIILMQGFLKSQNIRYIMMDVLARDYYKAMHNRSYNNYYNQIDKQNYIEFNKNGMLEWTYGCAQGPNGHFLDEGHGIVANKVYEHIRHLGWVS